MTKKVALCYPVIFESVKDYFASKDAEIILTDTIQKYSDYDLVIVYDEYDLVQKSDNIINIQPSLLPAYKGKNAILSAFNDGVKVSGISVHSKDKIISQYPVLIGVDTHIADFISEMQAVEKKLLPVVIDAVLNDRVFDFSDLFSHSCHTGGCLGCGGCH